MNEAQVQVFKKNMLFYDNLESNSTVSEDWAEIIVVDNKGLTWIMYIFVWSFVMSGSKALEDGNFNVLNFCGNIHPFRICHFLFKNF